jgi:hypothetical protein
MRTYRFRIYPKKHHVMAMNSMLDLSRELYNAMIQQRIYAYEQKKKVNYNSQQNEIPEIKRMFPNTKIYILWSYRMLPGDWTDHLTTFTEGLKRKGKGKKSRLVSQDSSPWIDIIR